MFGDGSPTQDNTAVNISIDWVAVLCAKLTDTQVQDDDANVGKSTRSGAVGKPNSTLESGSTTLAELPTRSLQSIVCPHAHCRKGSRKSSSSLPSVIECTVSLGTH